MRQSHRHFQPRTPAKAIQVLFEVSVYNSKLGTPSPYLALAVVLGADRALLAAMVGSWETIVRETLFPSSFSRTQKLSF